MYEYPYDAKLADVLIGALQVGVAIEDVCAAQELPLKNYYIWIQRGRADPESAYGKFTTRAKQAEQRGLKISELVRARNAVIARAALNRKRWPGKWSAATKVLAAKIEHGEQMALIEGNPANLTTMVASKEWVDELGTPSLFTGPPEALEVAPAAIPPPTPAPPSDRATGAYSGPYYPVRDLAKEAAASE